MRKLIPWIGIFYIALGVGGLLAWLFAEPTHVFGHVVSSNVSTLIAGGFLGLIVFGVLLMIGESDTRGR